jgi:hypothetical protein
MQQITAQEQENTQTINRTGPEAGAGGLRKIFGWTANFSYGPAFPQNLSKDFIIENKAIRIFMQWQGF